jgi:putative ABC transport system ATP-binding protein
VLDLLLTRVRGQGTGCLLVTHSQAAAQRTDRILRLTARGIVDAR